MSQAEQSHAQLTAEQEAEIAAFMAGPEIRQSWNNNIDSDHAMARQGIAHLVEVSGVVELQENVVAARNRGEEVSGPMPHSSRHK